MRDRRVLEIGRVKQWLGAPWERDVACEARERGGGLREQVFVGHDCQTSVARRPRGLPGCRTTLTLQTEVDELRLQKLHE